MKHRKKLVIILFAALAIVLLAAAAYSQNDTEKLQKSSVSSPGPNAPSSHTLSGDSVEIGSTSDMLELNQTEGDVEKSLADMLTDLMEEQKFIQRIFGNERINADIKGAVPFHVITEDGIVIEISEGMLEDPTMNLYSDEDTIRDIIGKELTISEAMEQGRIRYEGVGIIKSIKTGLLKTLVKLFS